MVANSDNCQLMFLSLKDDIKLCIDINGIVIQQTDSVKLFINYNVNEHRMTDTNSIFSRVGLAQRKQHCY